MSTNVEGELVSPNDAKPNVVRPDYYTPSIDEFHNGFEYEIFEDFDHYPKKSWHKQVFGVDGDNPESLGYVCQNSLERIRVKHIDKEDLLALGLSIFGKGNKTFYIKTDTVFMVHLLGSKTVITKDIKLPDKSDANTNVFDGIIKNKSELKRILQQVGCVQS